MSSESESSRREFLKGLASAATVGTVGLSGCLTLPPEPGSGPPGGPSEAPGPAQRPQTGPRTDGAFLYESFEQGEEYNMIDVPGDTGGYVPTNNNALRIDDQFSRTGTRSFRLQVNYDWNYPSDVRRGTNKPIPQNRDLMQEQGYSVWGEPFWFAFSIGLPPDWQPDSHLEQVHEFHRQVGQNPGGSIQAKKDYSGSDSGKPIATRIDGRELHFISDWVENGEDNRTIVPAPIELKSGSWYDVVMNLKWVKDGMDDTGFIRTWVNGHQVMNYTGNTAARDVLPPAPPEVRIYKFIWNRSSVTPDQRERVYHFDELRYGWGNASYEDMVPGSRGDVASRYPEWWAF